MNNASTNLLDRVQKVLREITSGEICYGFSTGGYTSVWEEDENTINSALDIQQLISGAKTQLEDEPDNDFVSITVVLANADGKVWPFQAAWHEDGGGILPLIHVYNDGKIIVITKNLKTAEYAIKTMKDKNQWQTRKKAWYGGPLSAKE